MRGRSRLGERFTVGAHVQVDGPIRAAPALARWQVILREVRDTWRGLLRIVEPDVGDRIVRLPLAFPKVLLSGLPAPFDIHLRAMGVGVEAVGECWPGANALLRTVWTRKSRSSTLTPVGLICGSAHSSIILLWIFSFESWSNLYGTFLRCVHGAESISSAAGGGSGGELRTRLDCRAQRRTAGP